jgi:mRNA-degrading endonuclease RelE of RelBE toxin-antitoxin system
MKSVTLPSFWDTYNSLDDSIRHKARKAFQLWEQNPFHPSLHFKCINTRENIWSVRIDLSYRAIGIFEKDTVTWFWIGSHDDYRRFFS